ncbi:MAG: mechanosensitive ion channel family protein [Anaerolineae bacterium]
MLIDQIPLLNQLDSPWREAVARLLLVALALILTYIFRRILTWMIVRPLRRFSVQTGYHYDDMFLDAAGAPIRYAVLAFAIFVSIELLAVGDRVDGVIGDVARSLLIFAILLLVYRLVDLFAPSSNRLLAVTGLKVEDQLLPFLRTAIKLIVIALGVVIIVQEWGYDVNGLIAGFGLAGLAFSLAAQDTVANLFGFIAIVSDNPFKIGEFIKTPDVEGIVEHVGLRSTRIRQLDQAVVYVPNNKIASSAILNWSRLTKRRIDYTLGLTYDATSGDLRVLLHRVREYLASQPTVEPDSIVVYFLNFGDSALEILVRCYVTIADWGEFTAEKERINLEVMDIVRELNMSIAFPSTSLYIENITDFFNPPEENDRPLLSPRERALMRGDFHEKPQSPPADPEENRTNQQDT